MVWYNEFSKDNAIKSELKCPEIRANAVIEPQKKAYNKAYFEILGIKIKMESIMSSIPAIFSKILEVSSVVPIELIVISIKLPGIA